MNLEIEHKYLVPNDDTANELISYAEGKVTVKHIKQGYFLLDGQEFRIRLIESDGLLTAYKTIKSHTDDPLVRVEVEESLPYVDAVSLYNNCSKFIEKDRHVFLYGKNQFELDFFKGLNDGIIILEVELASKNDVVSLPPIGMELKNITSDLSFRNDSLAKPKFLINIKKGIF